MQLPGDKTQIFESIRDNVDTLCDGGILAIDPSIGSQSSMPGWAYYWQGELVASGTVKIDPLGTKAVRLKTLYRELTKLSQHLHIDLCVYEQVPVSAHNGRNQTGHASLLMASGVCIAAVDAQEFIGITPIVWKCRTRPEYVKSDETDAIECGWVVIEMARIMRKAGMAKKKYKSTRHRGD